MAQLALVADTQIPPAIDPSSMVNAASGMPSSLPGGALARGARFSLTGVRLGPQREVKGDESNPPTMLGGVSVAIIHGEKYVSAGILLASATRIDGLIPMSAPLGPVRFTVTYKGQSSEPYAATLVEASFGFFTPDTAPERLAEAQRPVSASPGQSVLLWGTGLGDAQPQIFLAGKPVAARATNEDCCKGVNRIEFELPESAPSGCYVPVQASIGGRPSNVVGIAIHGPGQPCPERFAWLNEAIQHVRRAGFVALARVSVGRDPALKMGNYQFDFGVAAFGRQQAGQRPFPTLPPFDACTASSTRTNLHQLLSEARDPGAWTGMAYPPTGNPALDAGAELLVSGPGGTKLLRHDERRRRTYSSLLGGVVPFTQVPRMPLFLGPGVYDVTSSGGKDVGPFDVHIPAQRVLEWKNRAHLSEVHRSEGAMLEWKEASPDDAVLIAASSSDRFTGDSSVSVCLAYAKERRFAIPPLSLANLPPTADDLEPSFLLIAEIPVQPPVSIRARGLDAAFATFLSINARLVRFR